MKKIVLLSKNILILYLTITFIFILSSCDGTSKRTNLRLKSEINNHFTTILLETKINGYNNGDILIPKCGKTTFNTSNKITINILYEDITNLNQNLNIELIDDFIIIYEKDDTNNYYSYFIRFIKEEKKTNLYQTGELRLYYSNEGETKLLLFPFHLLDDQEFIENYLNDLESLDITSGLYNLKGNTVINDFVKFYNNIGWYDIELNNNILTINTTFDNDTFINSFNIIIEEHSKLKIL